MNDKPFLYLLDNIDKVDIDENLIPLFKELLIKFQMYFEEHDLLDCRDYVYLFDKYLINDSENKIKIRIIDDGDTAYNYDKKEIVVNKEMISFHRFCHEFIHFLVWTTRSDSKDKYNFERVETFLDEGATEKLARAISGYIPNQNISTYNDNVDFVKFLEKLYGEHDFHKLFLSSNSLAGSIFSNNGDIHNYLIILSLLKNRQYELLFYENNPNLNIDNNDNFFKELEKYLIKDILDNRDFKCNSIHDLIEITELLSERPVECKDLMDVFYIRLKNRLLAPLSFIDQLKFGEIITDILEAYSTLYMFNGGKYVDVKLNNISNPDNTDDYIMVKIDEEGNPIKNDLDVFKAGTKKQIKLIAYENSNLSSRECYKSDLIEINTLDFNTNKNELLNRINTLYDELFTYDENLSRLIVEQLIMEFYNTNLDTFINSSLEIEYLEDKLEPLLYYKVNEYINGLKNNKKI